jgi:hypothetical protein
MTKEALKSCNQLKQYFGNNMEALGMGGYQMDLVCKEVSKSHSHIYEIAEIIDNQMPLKYQDGWVKAMKKQGYYVTE